MKPDPSEVALRGRASGRPLRGLLWLKKSLKNSSNGEPGGNCGISGPPCPCRSPPPRFSGFSGFSDFTVCVVEMLTTEGNNLAARSAKLSGAGRAKTGVEPTDATNNNAANAAAAQCFRLDRNIGTLKNSSAKRGRSTFATKTGCRQRAGAPSRAGAKTVCLDRREVPRPD